MHLLPGPGYEYAKWKVARVGVDYNVEVAGLHCCVPCQQARAPMAMRVTSTAVEVFQRGQRIASHAQCAFHTLRWQRTCCRHSPTHGSTAHSFRVHAGGNELSRPRVQSDSALSGGFSGIS